MYLAFEGSAFQEYFTGEVEVIHALLDAPMNTRDSMNGWPLSFRMLVRDFLEDDVLSLAAAIAFYTALSFAPLVLLLVTLGGLLGDESRNEMLRLFQQELGPRAGEVTQEVLDAAKQAHPETSTARWVLSLGVLLVTASGVFGQLQSSLNRIWDVESQPLSGWLAAMTWLRRRLLSMGMVFALFFILLVSLVVSTLVQGLAPTLAESYSWAGRLGVTALSLAVNVLLFAAMFRFLPDVIIRWREVWLGGAITAGLFTAGKSVLAIYLAKGGIGEDYGHATGGLIVLLVWVYYSAVILLIGAEITQQQARRTGAARPRRYARWTLQRNP